MVRQDATKSPPSIATAALENGYPRPQFVRGRWLSLDGAWEYSRSLSSDAAATPDWRETIIVPFAPEAPLSGIGDESYHPVAWYRRQFEIPSDWAGQRIVVHFGAIDYHARVWVNGSLVSEHSGGHTPFQADITDNLRSGAQEVVVRVEDDPHEMDKPRGKQDWQPEAHAIWYPRTTGIWQSVWLEPVPPVHIERVRYTADLASFSISLETEVTGATEGLDLEVTLSLNGRVLCHDTVHLQGNTLRRRFDLPDPGIGDARSEYLWSPEHPTLVDVNLRLHHGQEVLDEVSSYTALREVATQGGRFLLNGRSYFLRLVLDQGYWRDGLMTAPDRDALRRDVELTKALGFNGVRKHQKVEDPRYLYWADRLGLVVWEELPSAYSYTPRSVARLTREWLEIIERDFNHPCIVTWVPFNESWGVPDLRTSQQQRDAVRALQSLAKALDPARPAVGNDGWEFVAGDLFTIHDYTTDASVLERRYQSRESIEATLTELRPSGRQLLAEPVALGERPVILSEFGGIRFSQEREGWGYSEVGSAENLLAEYRRLVAAASGAGLAGFCYTQLTDTFQEQNGLATMDRIPKAAADALARATRNEPEG